QDLDSLDHPNRSRNRPDRRRKIPAASALNGGTDAMSHGSYSVPHSVHGSYSLPPLKVEWSEDLANAILQIKFQSRTMVFRPAVKVLGRIQQAHFQAVGATEKVTNQFIRSMTPPNARGRFDKSLGRVMGEIIISNPADQVAVINALTTFVRHTK